MLAYSSLESLLTMSSIVSPRNHLAAILIGRPFSLTLFDVSVAFVPIAIVVTREIKKTEINCSSN